jgi:hypothetical protein
VGTDPRRRDPEGGSVNYEYTMPFGKFKHQRISEVPAWYLDFLYRQHWIDKFPSIKEYIQENREQINAELARDGGN